MDGLVVVYFYGKTVNLLTSIKQFTFQSNQAFYDALADEIEKYQRLLSRKRIGTNLIITSLLTVGDFSVLKSNGTVTYFIPDYDKQEFSSDINVLVNHVFVYPNNTNCTDS